MSKTIKIRIGKRLWIACDAQLVLDDQGDGFNHPIVRVDFFSPCRRGWGQEPCETYELDESVRRALRANARFHEEECARERAVKTAADKME